jgi:hypothetical protein
LKALYRVTHDKIPYSERILWPKVKLSLCLIKHDAMKAYGVDENLHVCLTFALDGRMFQIKILTRTLSVFEPTFRRRTCERTNRLTCPICVSFVCSERDQKKQSLSFVLKNTNLFRISSVFRSLLYLILYRRLFFSVLCMSNVSPQNSH